MVSHFSSPGAEPLLFFNALPFQLIYNDVHVPEFFIKWVMISRGDGAEKNGKWANKAFARRHANLCVCVGKLPELIETWLREMKKEKLGCWGAAGTVLP